MSKEQNLKIFSRLNNPGPQAAERKWNVQNKNLVHER